MWSGKNGAAGRTRAREGVKAAGAHGERCLGGLDPWPKALQKWQEENKANTAALQDYANGQAALQKAVQVLTDFYSKKAAAAAVLLQQKKIESAAPIGASLAPRYAKICSNVRKQRVKICEHVRIICKQILHCFVAWIAQSTVVSYLPSAFPSPYPIRLLAIGMSSVACWSLQNSVLCLCFSHKKC